MKQRNCDHCNLHMMWEAPMSIIFYCNFLHTNLRLPGIWSIYLLAPSDIIPRANSCFLRWCYILWFLLTFGHLYLFSNQFQGVFLSVGAAAARSRHVFSTWFFTKISRPYAWISLSVMNAEISVDCDIYSIQLVIVISLLQGGSMAGNVKQYMY